MIKTSIFNPQLLTDDIRDIILSQSDRWVIKKMRPDYVELEEDPNVVGHRNITLEELIKDYQERMKEEEEKKREEKERDADTKKILKEAERYSEKYIRKRNEKLKQGKEVDNEIDDEIFNEIEEENEKGIEEEEGSDTENYFDWARRIYKITSGLELSYEDKLKSMKEDESRENFKNDLEKIKKYRMEFERFK